MIYLQCMHSGDFNYKFLLKICHIKERHCNSKGKIIHIFIISCWRPPFGDTHSPVQDNQLVDIPFVQKVCQDLITN